MNRDSIDELRAANPVADDDLSSASLARIRARVSEEVMTTRSSPGHTAGRIVPAAVAAVAAVALVLFVGGGNGGPSVVPGPSTGTGSAMCVEPYVGPASIAARTLAFDGTVTAIAGEKVTFTVHTAYRGAAETSITLDAAGMTGTAITSAGGPNLAVGERYLVAGDDHFVWACGYTQPFDAGLAAQWATAAA
ncbi:MAG: hypothetical protein H0U52_16920 [Chloroflexi bacterium]|nr:hypothetical protein [Chloroflexota bacterium]